MKRRWFQKRENLLTCVGIALIAGEFIHAELLGGTFHPEFLVGAVALCGIGLAQKGDKNGS